MALVTADGAPATQVVGTMTVSAGIGSVFLDLGTMLNSLSPAGWVPARTVMALVTGDFTGATLVVFPVTAGALVGSVGPDLSPVLVARHPTLWMCARRSVVTLVATHFTPAAQVVGSVTWFAGF